MEKVLVTGANGYLGACVFKNLSKNFFVEKLEGRLEEIKPKSLNYDIVIHCAGALRYRQGQHKSANAEGTKTLINGLKAQAKLVYISSKSVYGIGLEGKFDEKVTLQPSDDYGISKYEGELAVVESGLPYIILRSSTFYGLGVNNLGPAFPSVAMTRLAYGNEIKLYTPDTMHEYLYVHDFASIISTLLETPNSWNSVFNASGPKRSLHNLISLIESCLLERKLNKGKIKKEYQAGQKLFYLNSSKLINLIGDKIYTPDSVVVERMADYIFSVKTV